jgi:DNA-binding CsgD family transcriptional regulator
MKGQTERTYHDLVRLSHAGLDPTALWQKVLHSLRRVIPVAAAFFATTDPATVLFTSAIADDVLLSATPAFLANEFLQDDANKFVQLVRRKGHVGSLDEVTQGALTTSPRYREILAPLALGDELRSALVVDGACWGAVCLHRERAQTPFGPAERAFLARVAPHLAHGLRTGLLLGAVETPAGREGPGLILLADDLSIVAMSPVAERWIDEFTDGHSEVDMPPPAIAAVAARLHELEEYADDADGDRMPRVRVRTRRGEWLTIHATRVRGRSTQHTAVILERAHPAEIAPLIVQSYGLSPRESELLRLIARGLSTQEIAQTCHISTDTVQDHCKSIFDKVGVRSRRELVAQLFERHFRP